MGAAGSGVSGADSVTGPRSASAMGDPRFDMPPAPSSSADHSAHGGGMYQQPRRAGSLAGALPGAGPSDAMSVAGSGIGGSSHMRESSADSFGIWPHRGGSEGSHHSGLPPSVQTPCFSLASPALRALCNPVSMRAPPTVSHMAQNARAHRVLYCHVADHPLCVQCTLATWSHDTSEPHISVTCRPTSGVTAGKHATSQSRCKSVEPLHRIGQQSLGHSRGAAS